MNNYFNKIDSRLLRLIGWVMVLGVIILSLIPLPPTSDAIAGSDKLLHLASYFLLSYWFFHSYYRHKLSIIFGFVLLGLGLEILQSFTPYRFLEWLDMLMNITGVLLAYMVFWQLKENLIYSLFSGFHRFSRSRRMIVGLVALSQNHSTMRLEIYGSPVGLA